MAEIGFYQGQSLKQNQTIAPQQQQALKILQMNTLELDSRIENELLENPLLELDDNSDEEQDEKDSDNDNDMDEEDVNDSYEESWEENNYDDIDMEFLTEKKSKEAIEASDSELYLKDEGTLQNKLLGQLMDYFVDEDEIKIAEFIIKSIDDNGYLKILNKNNEEMSKDDIVNYLKDQYGYDLDIELFDGILEKIKEMEPIGCGSVNVQDALLAQLKYSGRENSLHYEIIESYYKDFSKKNIKALSRKLDRPIDVIDQVFKEISLLNLYPGDKFANSYNVAMNVRVDVEVYLIENVPYFYLIKSPLQSLRLNSEYNALSKKLKGNEKKYLKEKKESAKFLINAIKQRKSTLEKVMTILLRKQEKYFITGDEKDMLPLNLQDIAVEAGVHQATVSRVVNSKYVKTPYGVTNLKYYFPGSIKKNGKGDKGKTNLAVMNYIKEIVDNEDKKMPFSDDQISAMLEFKKNVSVARRTISKYREKLGIPSKKYRKEFLK